MMGGISREEFAKSPCFDCGYRPAGKMQCKYFQVCERYEAWEDKDEDFMSFSLPTAEQKAKIEAEAQQEDLAAEKILEIAAKDNPNKVQEPKQAPETTTTEGCKVPDCPNSHHSRGFCRSHYKQWRDGKLEGYGEFTLQNKRISVASRKAWAEKRARGEGKKAPLKTGTIIAQLKDRLDLYKQELAVLKEKQDKLQTEHDRIITAIEVLEGEAA